MFSFSFVWSHTLLLLFMHFSLPKNIKKDIQKRHCKIWMSLDTHFSPRVTFDYQIVAWARRRSSLSSVKSRSRWLPLKRTLLYKLLADQCAKDAGKIRSKNSKEFRIATITAPRPHPVKSLLGRVAVLFPGVWRCPILRRFWWWYAHLRKVLSC